MPDLEISNLPSLAEASVQATDPLPIADLSASETKKVTVKDLIEAGVALIDAASIPATKIGTLGTNQVATAAIQDLAVTTAKIANGAITVTQITDATITGAKLVDNTITATQIAANAIGTSELADNAVDTGAIANNAITNVKINNGEIVYAKLNISDGDIPAAKITGNSITSAQIGANAVGASELADDAVDTAAVVNAAITGAKIATDTIGSGNIAANAIGASELADNAVDTGAIASNAVTTAKIADDQVTAAKLADNLAGTILATGAIGSTQIAADAVTSSELADNAVDTAAIAASAVTDAKVASGISGTKLTDGTVTAAKLNTSNINRSLNVASGSLGINNAVTGGAATRSGITYNAEGLITGTAALGASDLPLATTSAVGGVSVGTGLTVSGAGALSLTNSVTGATVSGITFNNQGMITAATGLVAANLPVATTSAKGAVQITSGGGLTVSGSGELSTSTSGISAGTYGKLTVNNKGIATAGAALAASDIPSLDAAKITTGSIAAARIGNDSIDGTKLSNTSTAIFQSIAQSGYPTAQFTGQILYDTVSDDAFIFDGNAWQAITTLTKGSLVFGGTYNASTSKMASTTSSGIAAGLAVGSNLPSPSSTMDGVYVVVETAGTPSAPAPVVALSPPDYILGVTNSAGSSYQEIDLSQTVAGQVASNITFTPYGQLSSTNVQDALQELETEKLALAGGTVTGQVLIGNTGSIVFEGSTVDAFETTLTVADPTTSDKTITLPNVTGTVITSGDTNTVTSTMVNASLVNANLAAGAAIAFSKLAALPSAQIIVGNGSTVPTAVAVTGDIGINNAGLTSITAGAIVNADINASAAIAGSKVTTGTTSAVGVLQLTDSATSTSATTAATPAAVKTAKDAADAAAVTANAALPKAGGTMTDNLIIDNGKELRLSEADSDGAHYTGLKAQAQSSDITLTLPAVAPTTGQVLKSGSTATTLEWATDSATDATKLPLAGGTMSGAIAMGTSKITGLGDPTGAQDAATKTYVDTADALKLNLAGGTLTGNLTLNAQSDVRFADADSSAYVALQAPSTVGSSYTLTLPAADGTNGQALISDGSGNLSFTSISTGAAGSNTQVQFNNSGAFAGSSSLTFNSGTGALTATSFVGALTGNVTGNASGSSGSCTGNAATASLSTEFTVTANNTADETVYPLFVDGATGSQGAETDTGLSYNPSSGLLTSTGFVGALTGNVTGNTSGSAGSCTGNAATATALATARNIGGVSFDGTAAIDLPGVNASGTQDTSGTAAVATAFTTTANNSTDETVYPVFVDGTTGSQGAETDTGLTYNPSSGLLTSTAFAGALTGNVTGNASGSAATVTGAAQSAITSLGTLTALVVNGNLGVGSSPSYGTSGQVLTSAGSGSAPSWAAIPSSDPEISIVASGSISTGQVVHLKSDGKVQVPTGSAQDVTDTAVDSNNYHYEACGYYDSGQNKIFVAYRDSNNYGSGVVGTISGTSISFGTPAVFNSQGTYYLRVAYSAAASHGIVMYDKDNSGYNAAQAVKISGTTPSYNDVEEVGGYEQGAQHGCIGATTDTYSSDSPACACIHLNNSSDKKIGVKRLVMGSYASPSLANGGDASISDNGMGYSSIAYAPDPAFRHLVTFAKQGSSSTGVYYRGIYITENSNVNFTETSVHTIDNSCRCTGTSIAFDTTNKKFLIVYKDHTNSKVKCLVVASEMSGGSWSLTNGAATDVFSSFTSTLSTRSLAFNPDTGKFVFHYPSASGSKIRYATLNSSDNVASWSAEESGRTNAANDATNVMYDTTSNQEVFGYYGSNTTSRWGIKTPASTTITTANYLGVSSGNYSDGDTAVIKISGSTVASSSLTPGTQIYSSDTGALSSTAGTTSVIVGKALSATSVLITE